METLNVNFVDFLNTLLPYATAVIGGIVLAFFTEVVKWAKTIPINAGQKGRILTFVSILAAAGNIVRMFVNGEFDDPATVAKYAELAATWLMTWGSAHLSYKGLIKQPEIQ